MKGESKNKLVFSITAALVLAVLVFNFSVQTAQAFFISASWEINPAVWWNAIQGFLKEWGLDKVFFNIAMSTVQDMGNQLVNWVATGQGGAPFFVRNWRGFLLNAADVAVNEFDKFLKEKAVAHQDNQWGACTDACYEDFDPNAENDLMVACLQECDSAFPATNPNSLVCAPFQNVLKVGLSVSGGLNPYGKTLPGRLQCSLDRIYNNTEAFARYLGNFENGGWVAFRQYHSPNANPFMVYLNGLDSFQQHLALTQQSRINEAAAGQGFLSKTREVNSTLNQAIQVPAKHIAQRLADTEKSSYEKVAMADELAEVIAGLASAALKRGMRELAK